VPTRQGAAEIDLRRLRLALTVALPLCFRLVLALGIGRHL
jgi:hypothetical protein